MVFDGTEYGVGPACFVEDLATLLSDAFYTLVKMYPRWLLMLAREQVARTRYLELPSMHLCAIGQKLLTLYGDKGDEVPSKYR